MTLKLIILSEIQTKMNLKVIILSEIQTKRVHSSIIPFICKFRNANYSTVSGNRSVVAWWVVVVMRSKSKREEDEENWVC